MKRPSIEIFHYHKRLIVQHIKIIQLNDVRVAQRSNQFRFASKAFRKPWVACQMGMNNLDRHVAVERWIVREIDGCHSAMTQPPRDNVLAKSRRDHFARATLQH